ncbi:DUF4397 domain-containing protein [Marinicrinis lubricantis]|uniref:DUF4397 domain-containing protein n=1 Tax=Marinicrinis lubricantis TaxID=2086470 RepID=A0ABW1IK74_9BACL
MEDWRLTLQKVELYGTLANFYRFSNPELHMYYDKKAVQAVQKLNEYIRMYGDPFEQQKGIPSAVQPGPNSAYPMPAAGPYPYVNPYLGQLPPLASPGEMETGRVRILHASMDTPALDIYVNKKKLATQLKFKQVTDYEPLVPGNYRIEVYAAGEKSRPLLETRATVQPGNTYTAVATGHSERLELLPVLDEPFVLPKMTKLRLVHLSPKTTAIDLALKQGNVIFPGVVYRRSSPYVPLEPGTYDLELRAAGMNEVLLDLPNVTLEADRVYSIAAVSTIQRKSGLDVILLQG